MEKMQGTIFNIQKFSIHDGPGIRTTVFFKGCPLRCWWCHNPESLSNKVQVMINSSKCTLCGKCVEVCPNSAFKIKNEKELIYLKNKCNFEGQCAYYCPTDAIEIVGEVKSLEEVMKEIEKDKVFYETTEGGVTFSGGEPFNQTEFLLELIKESKNKDISVAVDTSGMTFWENIQKTTDYVDYYLYDLKMMDREKHKKYTGLDNGLILDNLKKLDQELEGKKGKIFLRLILLEGINDSDQDIDLILDFIKDLKNIQQVNLLPYHKMGREKYQRLNLEYKMSDEEKPDDNKLKDIKAKFERNKYLTVIGG